MNSEIRIFKEYIPEDYVGEYPNITIHMKPSQEFQAYELEKIIRESLRILEGKR